VLYFVQKQTEENPDFVAENLKDICASIQFAIVRILMDKLKKAVKQTGINQIAIAGGVSANSGIRNALIEAEKKHGWNCFLPKFEYTTDNAAMIAIAGHYKFLNQDFSDFSTTAQARYKF
jgi:N6-L-threonylcarbamoyladenine synthase